MKLERKVCAVTGGASGIGAAICERFAAEGAIVASLDIQPADDASAVSVPCDVSNSSSVNAAFEHIISAFGRLDVLVNNAGIVGKTEYQRVQAVIEKRVNEAADGHALSPLNATLLLSDHEWRSMIATHLDGTFFCTRAAIAQMTRQRSGVIVNMSSVNGIQGGLGNPHYSAAKAGILGFTRSVAKEVIGEGIRINAVAPGFVETPLRDTISKTLRDSQIRSTPLGRAATAQEIAAAVLFLASEDSAYLVGETLNVNGGFMTV